MMESYLKDKLDNIIRETSEDEVLNEMSSSAVLRWVHECGLNYTVTDNDEAILALKEVGKYLSPKRYLDKNDLKKEICDFIDFWF